MKYLCIKQKFITFEESKEIINMLNQSEWNYKKDLNSTANV